MKLHEHFIVKHLMCLHNIYIFIRKLSIILRLQEKTWFKGLMHPQKLTAVILTDVMKDTRITFILCFKRRPYKEVP